MKYIQSKYLCLKKILKRFAINIYYYFYGSSSQYGEDLILDRLLKRKTGFFVDIGANHPKHFSNTYRFYKKGWRGINIEPDPNLFFNFVNDRPNDINLNIGVGAADKSMLFYRISANTLSTFNKKSANIAIKDGHELLEVCQIPVLRLDTIFEKHRPSGVIDFMSIDVEGYEVEVLSSNNWSKFRPHLLIVEINQNTKKIKKFLQCVGYIEVFGNGTNSIFRDHQLMG